MLSRDFFLYVQNPIPSSPSPPSTIPISPLNGMLIIGESEECVDDDDDAEDNERGYSTSIKSRELPEYNSDGICITSRGTTKAMCFDEHREDEGEDEIRLDHRDYLKYLVASHETVVRGHGGEYRDP